MQHSHHHATREESEDVLDLMTIREGEDAKKIQELLRSEFLEVHRQLDELSRGQASLTSSMEKMSGSLVRLASQDPRLSTVDLMAAQGDGSGQEEESGVKSDPNMPRPDLAEDEEDAVGQRTASGSLTLHTGLTMEVAQMTMVRSAQSVRNQTAMSQLSRIIAVDRAAREAEEQIGEQWKKSSLFQKMLMLRKSTKALALDAAISLVIISNSIFIGISADNWHGEINIYCYIDVVFGLLFVSELVLKLSLQGFSGHFNGTDRISNCFDVTLVVLDTLQLLLVFFAKEANKKLQDEGIPSASLFRVIRVVRVTRIIRLLRFPIFYDLLKMVEGVIMGQQTLLWACLLFGLVVYLLSLLCKDAFGGSDRQQYIEVYQHFNSVPRSMYTVFRCSFGDCTTEGGQPIPEFIQKYYGGSMSILYCFFFFFITIGLFNVISAIFLDSTMGRAAENQSRKLAEKLLNDKLWCKNVCIILRACLREQGDWSARVLEESDGHIDESMFYTEFTAECVHHVCVNDKDVRYALTNLDISVHDHEKLADILDPDHSGTIGFPELVNGLQRLRGQPRRSDVVTVDLMLRATQEKLDDMQHLLVQKLEQIFLLQKNNFALLRRIMAIWTTKRNTDFLGREMSRPHSEPAYPAHMNAVIRI